MRDLPADGGRRYPTCADVAELRVVITGGAKGLGRAIASAFHANGSYVALVGRDGAALEGARAQLGGSRVLVHVGDVSDVSCNEAVVMRVVRAWGGLDVWIANAGISPVVGRATRLDPETWRRVMAVNLDGVFFGACAAARGMTHGGRIVITGSVLGSRPMGGLAAYSAAKAGVVGLAKTLAIELASDGILVNVVEPGWFESPLTAGWRSSPELEKGVLDHTSLRRWGRDEDLVGAFLFLASKGAEFITGSVLTVDGGYLLT
ncbi:MAG: SDR family NAD(P)-dependent oxidoreductase [Candidatus Dormibacteria bacterium]